MTGPIVESTPEFFTKGKANIAASPLRVRCKHAFNNCMMEAGFPPARWLFPDPDEPVEADYLFPLLPHGWTWQSDGAEAFSVAAKKAQALVTAEIGWPGKRRYDPAG